MTALLQSLRHAWRNLRKSPGTSVMAVLALALGIGLTSAMFSIVYGVVIKGLPFERAERLMHLEGNNLERDQTSLEVSLYDFLEWREAQTSFESLAAFYEGTINVSDDEGFPERYEGAFLSHDAFEILRLEPALGRGFAPGEDRPGAAPVVILGHDLWQTRYAGDPEVLGRVLRVNGEATTVVGVMPAGFEFPIRQQIWVPLRRDPLEDPRGEGLTLEVFGRLRDGVTIDQARAEMSAIAERIAEAHPETNEGYGAVVKPYAEEYVDEEVRGLLYLMLFAVGLVLLLACANVASLLLARATTRSKEIALRSALGASRRRVVSQLLAESGLLAVSGALLGLLIAAVSVYWVNRAIAWDDHPFWIDIALHPPVLAFTVAVTLAAALVAGLVPALQASRVDLNDVLKDESRSSSASLSVGRFSRLVVVFEIAFACVLLTFSSLMIRSIVNLRGLDLGFEVERVMTARVGLFESVYPEEEDRRRFFEQLVERLEKMPGVVSATVASSLPSMGYDGAVYEIEGESYAEPRDYPSSGLSVVTPGFFETFGIPILRGRGFGVEDRADAAPVVVVNRSFAARHWPGEDPLDRRLRLGRGDVEESWRTVVGVVPDTWIGDLDDDEQEGFYLPHSQLDRRFMSLAVKTTSGDPASAAPALREAVLELDRDLPIYWVQPMARILYEQSFFFNFFAVLFSVFGAAALLLAAVGIYGVIAFSVGRRTQEIGIRMALGARRRDVVGMILRQGSLRLALGLGIGLAIAALGSRFLEGMLFGIEPADLATFAGTALFLAAVATAACWIPALRAARTEPTVALRTE